VRRQIKFAFYALVLGGVAAGTVGWSAHARTVKVKLDGQVRSVQTDASDVSGVLKSARVQVGEHDLVAPPLSAPIQDGSEIIVSKGHLLHLSVDGASRDVWVNAASVNEALAQLGYSSNSFVSVSRSKRLDDGATALAINEPKRVTFVVDGRHVVAVSGGPDVAHAVTDAGLALGQADRLSVPAASGLTTTEVIRIQRVSFGATVGTRPVPFSTVRRFDANSYQGTTAVLRAGRSGVQKVSYQLVYVDGKLSGRVVQQVAPVTSPVDQIVRVGTRPAPAFVTSVPAGSNQRIAAGMVAARGWDGNEFQCLVSLWTKESGWQTSASNPSGAYGIPQSLPGDKMASVGSDWQTSATTQITWGVNYIAGVYGTPCAAWGHSQATNWY